MRSSSSPCGRTVGAGAVISNIRRLSRTRAGNFSFQPLKFELEPLDRFKEFCFLRLLLPLLALAVGGEDVGPSFQQLPFPGAYQVGMNLVFTG